MDINHLHKVNARRAVLPLQFEPRMTKTLRLYRNIFVYYLKHAGRVYHTRDMREPVKQRIAEARIKILQSMAFAKAIAPVIAVELAERYDTRPPVQQVVVEARFPEVVEYLDAFRLADQLFSVIYAEELREQFPYEQRQAISSAVSEALRGAAQVIAEAGKGEGARAAVAS